MAGRGPMTLHCRRVVPAASERPWLVLLHGLLGSGDDWRALCPFLADFPLLLVDLPGHGAAHSRTARDFADVSRQLTSTLQAQGVGRYWLAGYSLGGRIAMYHAAYGDAEGMQGLLAEGGNPGLTEPALRQARLAHDRQWARRLRQEPLAQVLDAWYRQPVFADVTPDERAALVALRCRNHGPSVAAMLEATSLGHQPWLLDALRRRRLPFGYLCGANDGKFQALAAQYALPLLTVPQAGHNAHRANPEAYARQMRAFISMSGAAGAE